MAKGSKGTVSLDDLYKPDIGINNIANVNETLTIEDISVVITGEDLKFKIPAAWLYPNAAAGAHIHCRLSWECIQFPPNSLTSMYVDCDVFSKMEVSKTSVKKDGLYDQERIFDSIEDGGANIRKWSIRATIQPSKSAHKATISLGAVPWKTSDFASKPGNVDAASYPNIHIKFMDAVSFNGCNSEEMGLPFYLLLSYHEEGRLCIDTKSDCRQFTENLMEAVTSLYQAAKKPVCLNMENWLEAFPANNGEPDHDDIASKFTFPDIQTTNDTESNDGE